MRRNVYTLTLCLILISSAVYAQSKKKKTKPVLVAAIAQMTESQKELHALNRLTFGARAGDLDEIHKLGLQTWIDRQLHPESIPENPGLEARLQPLDTLRMDSEELVKRYPPPQTIKAIADGRQPMPTDPQERRVMAKMLEKYRQKQQPDAAPAAKPDIASLHLDADQKQILTARGNPDAKLTLLESLPADEQWDALDAMPNPMRQRLFVMAPVDLRRKIQTFNGPAQILNQDITQAKIDRAVYSNRQLEEVLADFWYNHFNVDINKGQDKYMVTAYERDAVRPHVLGKFKDLLLATARSPAMLFYLDNFQSVGPNAPGPAAGPGKGRKQGLNENYGRELMELHTLGVDGGYTQQDVTEVARCFTGWTIRNPQQGGGFQFAPRRHDNGEKHVLGITIPAGGGMEDGLKVIDILVHHPSTAQFISKSLAIRFVSDNPPESLITKMAATFTATDGDIREVMSTMLKAPEFWNPANFRSKVKSPLEMLVSALRAVNGDVDYIMQVNGIMNQLGEPLYRKLEPTGYSNRSTDWMNSASLLARMNFANSLAQGKVNGVKVDTAQFSGDASTIEQRILLMPPSKDAQEAIQAGLAEQQTQPAQIGPLVAGLTMGSPDFQRR